MPRNYSISLLIYILIIFLFSRTCFSAKHVEIINRLPSNLHPLRLHCRSKDNDLGYHDLGVAQLYTWKFQENVIGTTLFVCDFWWEAKHAAFHVFDSDILRRIDGGDMFSYEARADGFYFWVKSYWQIVNNWTVD